VHVDDAGAATRLRAERAEVAVDPETTQLVDALIGPEARLLTAGQEQGKATVAIAHEALLEAWPQLRDWLAEVRRDLQRRAKAQELKPFSFLNERDPINRLKHSGWKMSSDNHFGSLGYYLVISHPDVRSGKPIIACRTHEIKRLKERNSKWLTELRDYIGRSGRPVVEIDNSYYNLYAGYDEVGGNIYTIDKKTPFYARLSEWNRKLSELLD
jgi:hypothetical protein